MKGGGYRRIKPTKLEKYEAPPIQIQYGAFFSNSDQLRISDKYKRNLDKTECQLFSLTLSLLEYLRKMNIV